MNAHRHGGPERRCRRMIILAKRLCDGLSVTTRLIRERFGVSAAVAKRDMKLLETTLRVDVVRLGSGPCGAKELRLAVQTACLPRARSALSSPISDTVL